MRLGYNPLTSTNISGSVAVYQVSEHPDALLEILKHVPLGNTVEYNCQHWVGDGLQALVVNGYLMAQRRTDVLDETVDLLLPGADDAL